MSLSGRAVTNARLSVIRAEAAGWSTVAGVLAVGAYIMGSVAAMPALRTAAIACSILSMVLQFASLHLMARVFLCLALLSWCLGIHFFPLQRESLVRSLEQGVAFACFLSVLGMIRHPVRQSAFLKRAIAALLVIPPRWQYVSVTLASQFLSLLFNIGVIPLMFDALAHHKAKATTQQEQVLVLASLRGAVLTTLWSPLGIGFTIVTVSITGLSSVGLFAVALGLGMLVTILDSVTRQLPSAEGGPSVPPPESVPGARRAMARTLCLCVLLLSAALVMHTLSGWPQLVCVMILLLVVGLVWLRAERMDTDSYWAQCRQMLRGMNTMAMESAMYLSAVVIGACMSFVVQTLSVWHTLQTGSAMGWVMLVACMGVVPLAGMLMIPHSVLVVLLAQLFGNTELGHTHGLALGMALSAGWAMAVATSPIAAATIMTANICGVTSRQVGACLNRGFLILLGSVSSALVLLLYISGY